MMHTTNSMSENELLRLNHATLLYGNVIGVNDIDVALPTGAYALIGPNGAGKSTLIGLLTGALKPTLGDVRVLGSDPFRSPSVLGRIGLCPATDILLHNVSARKWLELQLALSGWRRRDASQRVQELLEQVDLVGAADRPLHTYSLGMRQRCKFAQAIAHRPELLILDEPFNGLDPVARHQLTQLLIEWKESGRSLIIANHVLHEAEKITDSFLLIYGGRLLASGTAGELHRLLSSLPQEFEIECNDPRLLASLLARETWTRSLDLEDAQGRLRIAIEKPLEFYAALCGWSTSHNLQIDRLLGADGDISQLFRLLVSKHRGEVFHSSPIKRLS
ncbi:Daunorubicin/doxorubicin resistance ATP-binding protein DrrA [Pirellula sp. SH-Sr6A]|nr:Daunorubicin/doxorubicin resistance ATP-binding protein DrrA [Pirellula sp. SH-Sr6A]